MSDTELHSLVADGHAGILVTVKRDGRPQLSNVNHIYDPVARLLRVSITADRAKSKNLARDPRASYHVTSPDFWRWAVVEGDVELTPVASATDDPTVEELIEVYRAVSGREHPDWDEYRAAMVSDRRQVVRLHVTHAYGQV